MADLFIALALCSALSILLCIAWVIAEMGLIVIEAIAYKKKKNRESESRSFKKILTR